MKHLRRKSLPVDSNVETRITILNDIRGSEKSEWIDLRLSEWVFDDAGVYIPPDVADKIIESVKLSDRTN